MISSVFRTIVCSAILAAVAYAQDGSQPSKLEARVAKKAKELRPSAGRLKWQQIPWMTNLAAGLQVARQEGRPVLLWGSDDEPLERC